MLIGLWHFSFHVADIDVSIDFYTDLGMSLIHRQQQSNEYTSKLVGYEAASLRIAQLAMPEGCRATASSHDLELVEYVHPRFPQRPLERAMPGTGHLAFVVDDMHAEYDRLKAANVTFLSPPNAITAGINAGGYACYFLDPDAITLELVQPPTHPHR